MEKKDYYELLGLKKGATSAEIKSAYRKLAHKYHPDKGEGDEKKFKEVNEAYQILSDPKKKEAYDQYGHNSPFGSGGGQTGGFDWSQYAQGGGGQGPEGFDFSDTGGFSDIFEQFFSGGGGRSRGRGRSGGVNLETSMAIDFKESVFGVEKDLNINKYSVCDKCNGEGSEPGSKKKTCPTCKGRGKVEIAQKTIFGNVLSQQICPDCEGEGKVPEKICTKCKGEGRVKEPEKIKVRIPAGVEDGSTIRVRGAGEAGKKGAAPGDLYIQIRVTPSPEFHREGYDIVNTAEITFPEATLGATVDVPTIEGNLKLKIPAGTQSGKVFKISGKGVTQESTGRRGDHLVEVKVKTPSRLTRKQKELLEEFKKDDKDHKRRWWG